MFESSILVVCRIIKDNGKMNIFEHEKVKKFYLHLCILRSYYNQMKKNDKQMNKQKGDTDTRNQDILVKE